MAGRKANGEGTIFQRADGRWCGAGYVLTADGTRKRIYVYGAPLAARRPTSSPRNWPTRNGALSWPPTQTSPLASA